MRKHRLYLSVFLFGGMGFVILALLAITTIRNAMRDKTLIIQNALTQGYWIARSLEIGHSMMMQDHTHALRDIIEEVERAATVLFLDVDHYTKISADVSPDALNQLIEKCFAAFLDTILSHGGEINETAGDAIMAIFTARSQQTHALNAARAAVGVREQASALNHQRSSDAPEILVSIGMNTGPVLLGATMCRGMRGKMAPESNA